MSVSGTSKQEHKILEMGEIGHKLFPRITLLNFKGSFRLGINSALKVSGYGSWQELVEKSNAEKKRFFEHILEETKPKLQGIGLTDSEIETVFKSVRKINETYLKKS